VSLILFVIYLSSVFQAIERAVLDIQALSFADNLGLVVPASSIAQVCKKLQNAGEAAIEWGLQNAVKFNSKKTEAVLFT